VVIFITIPLAAVAWIARAAVIRAKSNLVVDVKTIVATNIVEFHKVRMPLAREFAGGVLNNFTRLGVVVLVDAMARICQWR
jgi:hypothetical protein